MALFPTTTNKQLKKNVSYGSEEVDRLIKMEKILMKKYRWNYSQLHKNLVEDRYQMIEVA